MRLVTLASALVVLSSVLSAGCVVRTRARPMAVEVHPAKHAHSHCHARGKHGKRVCHGHPHGPAHH
jgi:hypothetical protein